MQQLAGKVAIVTGAASGIGQALAQQLDTLGVQLMLCDINEVGLAETARDLSRPPLLTEVVDVANREAVYAFAEKARQVSPDIHIVINNAGVTVSQTLEDINYDDFEWVMGINFWGVVYGTKAFLPDLKRQAEACVVNVSSVFGLFSYPTQGSYNASKFAVRGFTECLRIELENTGVDVISVHPGGIKTNIARNARFYTAPGGDDHGQLSNDFDKMAQTTAEDAASTIIEGIQSSRHRVLIGNDAKVMDITQRVLPSKYWKVLGMMQRGATRLARRG